jgi:hypothetical protein
MDLPVRLDYAEGQMFSVPEFGRAAFVGNS